LIDDGETCPVCGEPFVTSFVRSEPVRNPDTGRDHGWFRDVRTLRHSDGREHRVPVGAVFQR